MELQPTSMFFIWLIFSIVATFFISKTAYNVGVKKGRTEGFTKAMDMKISKVMHMHADGIEDLQKFTDTLNDGKILHKDDIGELFK